MKQDAIDCLAENGKLSDPRYQQFPEAHEARLKARCKACWHLRQHFPDWVSGYVKRWASEKENGRGLERPTSGGTDGSGVA